MIDFPFLIDEGVIDPEDAELFWFAEDAPSIWNSIVAWYRSAGEDHFRRLSGAGHMEISFHGADRDVTGSCHLLECAGKRLLIDCGMFQGARELEEENARRLGFDAATLDFLLLTHAHLDHCGRLPLLAKRGFRGEIIATAATRELAQIVLQDSAHMAEEDAAWRTRRAQAAQR